MNVLIFYTLLHVQYNFYWKLNVLCISFTTKHPFQHISCHIRTLTDCSIGIINHFIVLPHSDISSKAHWYNIPPGHIILATGHTVFVLNYTLYVEYLTKSRLLIWNIWLYLVGNWTQPQTREQMLYHQAAGNGNNLY